MKRAAPSLLLARKTSSRAHACYSPSAHGRPVCVSVSIDPTPRGLTDARNSYATSGGTRNRATPIGAIGPRRPHNRISGLQKPSRFLRHPAGHGTCRVLLVESDTGFEIDRHRLWSNSPCRFAVRFSRTTRNRRECPTRLARWYFNPNYRTASSVSRQEPGWRCEKLNRARRLAKLVAARRTGSGPTCR